MVILMDKPVMPNTGNKMQIEYYCSPLIHRKISKIHEIRGRETKT